MGGHELQIGKAGEYLAMADLLLKGHEAFLTDQGMKYDLVFEVDNKLIRIQVKTTRDRRGMNKNYRAKMYLFSVRYAGKHGTRMYDVSEFDGFALVCLDKMQVFYYPFYETINKTLILRDQDLSYNVNHANTADYIQEYTLEKFIEWIRKGKPQRGIYSSRCLSMFEDVEADEDWSQYE